MTGLTLPARSRSTLLATSALALLAAQGAWTPALANPSGGTVTHGGATITTAPDTVTIEQTTDRAVIEWQDFSVDGGETTRFVQPNASSVALNRVTGDNASVINGTITANGNVFLINRNGVLVGSGANIDVGGLVATTSDIDDGAFMAGGGRFDTPTDNPSATVVNQGTITVADHGIAALVGPTVENDGVIAARLGTVALGSAETFTVDLAGDGLISFDTGQPVARDAGTPQVSNAGTIAAAGGTVILSAGQAAAVVDKAIDMTGVVTATAISAEGGVIVLSGGEGDVSVDGTLDVSGTGAGTSGGTIEVTGKTVSLGATASLDAGGTAGGGAIRVGGGLKGTGTTPRAKTTSVAEGARLDASARDEGDGGLIVVWSDEKTTFGGTVLATGGTNGGDGGLIETSSAGMLDFGDFTIDASAPAGSGGEWLIDPGDVFILEEEAGNLPSNPFDPSNDTTLIFIDSIAAVLATGTDVTINTGSVGDGLSGTGEIGWEASTLPFAIGGDGSATLTLNALAGINWTGNLIASAGDLAVVLNAGEAISFGTGTITATTIEMNGCLTSATCGAPVGSGGDDFIGISLSPGGSGSLLDLTADVVSLRAGGGGLFVGDGTTIDVANSLILQGRGDEAFTFQAGSIVTTQPGSTASFQPTFANSDLVFVARSPRDFTNDNIDQNDLTALAAFDTIEFVTGAAFATFATDDGSASDASIGFFGGFADATLDLPNNLLLDANDGGSVIIDGSLTVSVGGAASFQAERLIAIANRFVAGADINFEAPDMLFGADVVSTGGGLALRGNIGAVNSMLFSASTDILIDGDLDGTSGTPAPVPPAIEMRTKSGTITVTGDSGGSFPLASLLAVSPVSIEIGSITTLGDQTLDAPVTTLTGIRYDADGFFQVSGTTLIANTASVIGTDGILFGGDVLRAPGAPAASLTAVAGLGADIDILGVAGTAADPLDALDLTADNVLSLQGAVTTGDQRFVATTAFFGGGTYASSLGGVSAAGVTTSLLDGTMVVEAAGDVAFGAVDAFSPGAGLRITSRGGRALLDGPLGLGSVLDFLSVTAATSIEIGDATIQSDLALDAPEITLLGMNYDVGGLFTATGDVLISDPTTITADGGVRIDGGIDLSAIASAEPTLSILSSDGAIAVLGAIGANAAPGAVSLTSSLSITTGGINGTGTVTQMAPLVTLLGNSSAGGNFVVIGDAVISGAVVIDVTGNVVFGGIVEGSGGPNPDSLMVTADQSILMDGTIGQSNSLSALDLSAGGAIGIMGARIDGDILLSAGLGTDLSGDYDSLLGSFELIGGARLPSPVRITAQNDVMLRGGIVSSGAGALVVQSMTGDIIATGSIFLDNVDFDAGGAMRVGDVTSAGVVSLLAATTLEIGGDITAGTGVGLGGAVRFATDSTVTGPSGIEIAGTIDSALSDVLTSIVLSSSGGPIGVSGAIGSVTPLLHLDVVAESGLVALGDVAVAGNFLLAGTSALLIGATYDASGTMTVDAPVSLTTSTRFTAGGDLRFTDGVDGLSPGTISFFAGSSGGDVELRGSVGTALALPLASVEVEAANVIRIGNGVNTVCDQRYTAGSEVLIRRGVLDSAMGDILIDGPLVVAAPIGITSGGDVTITSTIDAIEGEGGPVGSLSVLAGGALAILGAVGQDAPLLSFDLTAGTEIDPPSVTTFGPQSYTAPVIFLTGSDYLTNGGSFTTVGELRLTAPTVLIDTELPSITAVGFGGPILLDGLAIGNAVTLNAGDSDITATNVRFASLDVLGTLGSADMGGTIGGTGDVQAASRIGRPAVVATYLFNGCVMATTCGGIPSDTPVKITLPELIPAETDATAPPEVIFADTLDFVDDPRFVFSNTGKDALWRLDLTFPATGEENDQ